MISNLLAYLLEMLMWNSPVSAAVKGPSSSIDNLEIIDSGKTDQDKTCLTRLHGKDQV